VAGGGSGGGPVSAQLDGGPVRAHLDGRPVRILIFSFAHGHAVSYARLLAARADVDVAVSDPDHATAPDDAPRGRELAEAIGVRYFGTYEAAFGWQPDAVVVTSETSRHRELTLRAFGAGADVLCEKPLATSLADARAMVEAAEAADRVLMTAYPVRFSLAVQDAMARVRRGEVGEVLAIRGTNNGKLPSDRAWFVDPVAAGGGALVDHVVHCAQLIDELLGECPRSVRAVSNTVFHARLSPEVETGGIVSLVYPSGVVASIDCSWSWPDSAPNWGGLTLEVAGTRGVICVDPFAQHVGGFDRSGAVWQDCGADLDEAMLAEFVSAVRAHRVPEPDGRTGLRTFAVADAALRSARAGVPVTLDD
jgi:1,5-anhydro-D-fructose reductase (1,5-anhydro-D-mannitol-forming)